MKFFVPAADESQTEKVYGELAAMARCTAAPPGKRIAKIEFRHDGDDWIAEVGKPLRGVRVETKRRGGKKVTVTTPLSDQATVLAIFASTPFFVVTNARPLTDIASYWENPFMAGRPSSIEYFED